MACDLDVHLPVNGKLTCAQFEANFAALAELVARYQIVEELPETIAPCRQVLYNGTMWRGLLEGESSLPAGTPWPVKGYKELTLFIEFNEGSLDQLIINKDELTDGFIQVYPDVSGVINIEFDELVSPEDFRHYMPDVQMNDWADPSFKIEPRLVPVLAHPTDNIQFWQIYFNASTDSLYRIYFSVKLYPPQ